jgi:hypothetical protein
MTCWEFLSIAIAIASSFRWVRVRDGLYTEIAFGPPREFLARLP